jgi:lipopolysaccharide/colanic/teichoic acid biosynthesis glycosyltransferase
MNNIIDNKFIIKRVFDIIISIFLLIILSPIFLLTIIFIKIEDGGPVFYKQLRLGYKRQKFYIYKFRSMCENAEQMQKNLEKDNKNILFKIKNDPRITKTGRFIRKYSIDELPQLLNILKGEMSLVGPRPMIEKEIFELTEKYKNMNINKLFDVLPGITGLWQILKRGNPNENNKVKLEMFYVENRSVMLDIKILLKTIIVVLSHKGAY